MKTPFYDLHLSSGAKIVNFHGWDMPLQYSGIVEEHINTRAKVSLFDVSHMGRFEVRGANAYDLLQTLITNDLSKLDDNQALYSPICYDDGGIIDDLIIYRINSKRYLVVVNASNRTKDFQWITSRSEFSADVKDVSDATALLALQGPRAQDVLQHALPDIKFTDLKPFDLIKTNIFNLGQDNADKKPNEEDEKQKVKEEHFKQLEPELQYEAKEQEEKNELIISRTGYTGEDGFELFFDSSRFDIWEKLFR